jgi:hypothetical protein
MERPTRAQRKLLQTLAEKAYDLELSKLLKELRGKFDQWESGDITAWDLSDAIHEHHEGGGRELYQFYTAGQHYGYQVAHAIQGGYLTMDDVDETCRDRVQYFLDHLDDM